MEPPPAKGLEPSAEALSPEEPEPSADWPCAPAPDEPLWPGEPDMLLPANGFEPPPAAPANGLELSAEALSPEEPEPEPPPNGLAPPPKLTLVLFSVPLAAPSVPVPAVADWLEAVTYWLLLPSTLALGCALPWEAATNALLPPLTLTGVPFWEAATKALLPPSMPTEPEVPAATSWLLPPLTERLLPPLSTSWSLPPSTVTEASGAWLASSTICWLPPGIVLSPGWSTTTLPGPPAPAPPPPGAKAL